MASKVSIISNVYGQLGRPPINSLSPQIELDIIASNLYDIEMPAILSEFDYPVARKHKALTELSTAPTDPHYSKAFQLPNDMLMLLSPEKINYDYKIMGAEIWANVNEINIYYIKWEVDIDKGFSSPLTKYLFYRMCAALAFPITNKLTIQEFWEKKAAAYYGVASAITSRSEPSATIEDNRFINAFRSG